MSSSSISENHPQASRNLFSLSKSFKLFTLSSQISSLDISVYIFSLPISIWLFSQNLRFQFISSSCLRVLSICFNCSWNTSCKRSCFSGYSFESSDGSITGFQMSIFSSTPVISLSSF